MVKPEAAAVVYKLLMMGMRIPETCWAVFKRQAINLRDWCIWLVDLFECVMMHGLTNPKSVLHSTYVLTPTLPRISGDDCVWLVKRLTMRYGLCYFINIPQPTRKSFMTRRIIRLSIGSHKLNLNQYWTYSQTCSTFSGH